MGGGGVRKGGGVNELSEVSRGWQGVTGANPTETALYSFILSHLSRFMRQRDVHLGTSVPLQVGFRVLIPSGIYLLTKKNTC